ncbi:MAG: alpha/beta hydrolase [Candidatus Sericytochromatia bacterium]|nr:alpha/beta hydrolase [Candidatus Sericytochromatia bacterium]
MRQQALIKLPGISLNLVTHGNPEHRPLLMLHGFPDFHYGWRHQAPFFADRGYFVLTPDQRGFNLSEKPAVIQDYSMDRLGQDILQLLDHVNTGPLTVIGHDWGGAVAWWLAHHHPERLLQLVTLNMPHPQILKDFIRHHRPQTFKSWYMLFFQLPWLPEWILSWSGYVHFANVLKEGGKRGSFTQDDLKHYREAWARPEAMKAMLNWYRAAWRFPAGYPQSPVSVPTLMFWGLKDPHLVSEMIQPSLDLCSQARCIRLKHAVHWPQLDEFEAVNDHLLAFLRQADAST